VEARATSQDIEKLSTWNIARDGHTVVIHLSGTIRHTDTEINGTPTSVAPGGPGEVLLIPAGYRYACEAQGGVVSFAGLRFGGHYFRDAWGISDGDIELAPRLFERDTFVYELLKRLAGLVDRSDDLAQMTGRHLIHALGGQLLEISQTNQHAAPAVLTFSPRAIRYLQQYVQDHLNERIDVDDLARVVGIEVRDLFGAFKHAFNTTPAQYVIDQRVRRARWLLTNTQHDITTVAMLTGFASHSHLTTTFKKQTGLTPRAFRAEVR
jgi:AraC family transcriptional regulator